MTFASLDDVLAEVAELGHRFAAAGHRLFLVGGIVRDQWLDLALDAGTDIDLTTDARPDQIKALVSGWAEVLWTQGERFGTIGMRAGGRAYEVTTHRAESYTSDSRKPVVNFGDSIEVDLSRRDFTVNAMAIDVERRMLVDPWGGAADLEAGVLRTPLAPEVSFTDDPLRMLRAARFAAKYELRVDPDLIAAATELSTRLRIVAIERIGDEVERLLELSDPAIDLAFLSTTGVLAEVLCYGRPELIDDVTPRLAEALEVVSNLGADWRLRLAAIGVAVFDDEPGVALLCRRLRLSRDDSRHIVWLVRGALAVFVDGGSELSALRRWRIETDDPARSLLLADALSSGSAVVANFDSALNDLVRSEGDGFELLDGTAVMSLLDLPPGRDIGDALDFLRGRYYEQGPLSLEDQRLLMRNWWSDRSTNA